MTENNLENVEIGGKYTGGDDNSISLDGAAVSALNDIEHLENFSLNAQTHIASVSEKILESHDISLVNQGLDFSALEEKFQNVKCTKDYRENFKKASVYFHEIDQIRSNDSVEGGEITIQCIMILITKIYNHFFPKYENGDIIHSKIFGQIFDATSSKKEEIIATDILIYYTVNECGIFNERK